MTYYSFKSQTPSLGRNNISHHFHHLILANLN